MRWRVLIVLAATVALAADVGGRALLGRGIVGWASPVEAPPPEPGRAEDAVSVTCTNGKLTASVGGAWHANAAAPWKWDEGIRVALDEHGAVFEGRGCHGTLKAFVCTAEECRGPLALRVD